MRSPGTSPGTSPSAKHWLLSRAGLTLLVFLAIAAFYLVTEHTAHLFGALPFLLFALCPLMHLFMHGGQGGDHSAHHGGQNGRTSGGQQ
ncbi:MAG: DUF2933 domain-containing protein [Chloroflexi bacterium]|nr:DUF2933 domain-containing protein [Chloroflexota bacterium]